MKAKKALKRLAKAETLLAEVLDQYSGAQNGLRDLLGSAQSSLAQARVSLDLGAVPKKAPATEKQPKANRLSAAGRKRISMAAKKRWAAARSQKANAAAGQKLKRTA